MPHHVDIELKDGRVLKSQRLHADGAIERPLSNADRQLKFADCMTWAGLSDHGAVYQRIIGMGNPYSFRFLWDEMQQNLRA